ncbi:formimidoylglutamate deiminase [Flexibacterium corallicola]|uniref:formimidoylglutamate deiminase n=1 Tax=Flexibacterium corallicola TaxID=3037259 RepID=UPI00286EEA24|nr:formimidoylglutamate deiminase [Pseudovibrio sp. M1P-2-3]
MPAASETIIFASKALLSDGWANNVAVHFAKDGRIVSVMPDTFPEADDKHVGVLLPAPVNLHSHAFQRAMAGMSEWRTSGFDSFWTWRQIMYRFLDILAPEDIGSITSYVQMEMLEAGFAAMSEFHYLHHQKSGEPYENQAELSGQICSAAAETGIGLTLLPVLYSYGGCDRRALEAGQLRFGNDFDRFHRLYGGAAKFIKSLPEDSGLGVAPHSLRAVDDHGLAQMVELAGSRPLHMHIAEQTAEVQEILAAKGSRPVEWLLDHHSVGPNWCLIHCTQMTGKETEALAKTGAVAGLCPITEANLGDGIFSAVQYLTAGGRFGIGSDSNIRISLSEELRILEYSQRLRDRMRACAATSDKSTGRVLFESATRGGAQAAGRHSGQISVGFYADLLSLDENAIDLVGRERDEILDAFIFVGDDCLVKNVWSAGRHVVTHGKHVKGEAIRANYRKTMASLRARM